MARAMLDATQLLTFLGAAALLALTPGPVFFYIAARTLAGGRSVGIASCLGTAVGGLLQVAAGSAGLSALVLASAEAFIVLKAAGASYLVWLGWRALRSAGEDAPAPWEGAAAADRSGPRRAFRDGILVEALNPETAVFNLTFIPEFVQPAGAPVALQFALLGLLCVALNLAIDLMIARAAGSVRSGIAARPDLLRRLQQASGGAMIALGVGFALARQPQL